jgi:hypothetical protein
MSTDAENHITIGRRAGGEDWDFTENSADDLGDAHIRLIGGPVAKRKVTAKAAAKTASRMAMKGRRRKALTA